MIFNNLPSPAIQITSDLKILRINKLAEEQFSLNRILDNNKSVCFSRLISASDKSSFLHFLETPDPLNNLHFSTSLISQNLNRHDVQVKASTLDDGSHLLLLNKNGANTHGCNAPCFHSQVLDAQYQFNPGGILIVNPKMEMISFNQEFIHMWDIPDSIQASRDEDASLQIVLSKLKDPEGFLQKVTDLYSNPYKSHSDEVHLLDGRVYHRHTYPIFTKNEYLGRVWYFQDTTALKDAQAQLHFIAHHDALTGLPNRRLFHDILKQCISNAQRNNSKVGILFLDLDNFKSINDNFGHKAGDDLLKELSITLQQSLRESDIICRWGGDEFVIALPEIDGLENAELVAEKIRESIKDKYSGGKFAEFELGSSIGISLFPEHSTRPDRLIRNADQAMYVAKRHGKNKHSTFCKSNVPLETV